MTQQAPAMDVRQDGSLRSALAAVESFGQATKRLGYRYATTFGLVADRGIAFESKPLASPERMLVKQAYWRVCSSLRPRCCFANAAILSLAEPALQYIEGYAAARLPVPVLHAWCAINGKLIDVTWTHPRTGRYVAGNLPRDWQYVGVPISRDAVHHRLHDNPRALSHIDDWQNRWPMLREDA